MLLRLCHRRRLHLMTDFVCHCLEVSLSASVSLNDFSCNGFFSFDILYIPFLSTKPFSMRASISSAKLVFLVCGGEKCAYLPATNCMTTNIRGTSI